MLTTRDVLLTVVVLTIVEVCVTVGVGTRLVTVWLTSRTGVGNVVVDSWVLKTTDTTVWATAAGVEVVRIVSEVVSEDVMVGVGRTEVIVRRLIEVMVLEIVCVGSVVVVVF